MTAVVLPPDPEPTYRPEGDVVGARAWAQGLLSAAGLLDDRADWVETEAVALVGVPGGWAGRAGEGYRSHVRPVGADHQAASVALRRSASAVDRYADALTDLQHRAQGLAEQHLWVQTLVTQVRTAVRSLPAEPHPRDLQFLLDDVARAHAEVKALATDSARLRSDTLAAERVLVIMLRMQRGMTAARRRLTSTGGVDPRVATALAKAGVTADRLLDLTPADAAGWWGSLTASERDAMLVSHPEVIGTLDGVPSGARDTANRSLLDRDLTWLEAVEASGRLDETQARTLENARTVRAQIAVVEAAQDPVTLEPVAAQLYDYEPHAFDGDGRALLSVGDVAAADNVSFNVPGMTTTMDSLGGNVDDALGLYQETRWLDADATTASMVWIGYDAPSGGDLPGVLEQEMARDGGALLAADVTGFLASRGEDRPHLTVIGHSYGSTTTARGAVDVGMDVDDLVLIGSPGAGNGVGHATDLGLAPENVWVGNASTDWVTYLGSKGWVNLENLPGDLGQGNDPAEDAFGAQRFQAELVGRNTGPNFSDHTEYYRPGSESLANLAAIVTGHDDRVDLAEHRYDPWWRSPVDPEKSRTPTQRSHAP